MGAFYFVERGNFSAYSRSTGCRYFRMRGIRSRIIFLQKIFSTPTHSPNGIVPPFESLRKVHWHFSLSPLNKITTPKGGILYERRERDSNPRGAFTPNSFQDCRLQQLSHLSIFIQL